MFKLIGKMHKKIIILSLIVLALIGFSSILPVQHFINPNKLTGDYDYSNTNGEFLGKKVTSNPTNMPEDTKVLGFNDSSKRIEVDLTNQRLYAFEGEHKIYDFLISSGKWGKTPTGIFNVWGKFRYIKMEGGRKDINTYYYLPNVPYTMFFSNDKIPSYRGYAIHGTYWHNNFGHPMSHGCINMKTEEAGLIYNWANPYVGFDKSGRATIDNPGIQITIYGVAPTS